MLSSSRFVVAIHALSVLARSAGKGPVCSTAIAGSVHTNPVVIRRLMSELEKSAIVKSTAGRTGGFEPLEFHWRMFTARLKTKAFSACTKRTLKPIVQWRHS
jgi:predicted transcriptional regulator